MNTNLRRMATAVMLGVMAAGIASAAQGPAPQPAQPKPAVAAQPTVEAEPFQSGRPSLKTRPTGDRNIIMTVADALGFVRGMGAGSTNTLNRLQWLGSGSLTVDGRRSAVSRYSYAMSLSLNGAREDIQMTPAGGKPQRQVQAFLKDVAWDETTPGVGAKGAGGDALLERRMKYLRTPFGFAQALLRADATAVKITDPGAGGTISIEATLEGVPVRATLDRYYRPASISMTVAGQRVETRYSRYKDLHEYGVMFATRVVETVNGQPRLDLTIKDGRVASYLILQPPGATATGQP